MLNELIEDAENRMQNALNVMEEDFQAIRTGRASPALIEKLQVEYYGTALPLIQLATISVPESRQLLIRPFDRAHLKPLNGRYLPATWGSPPITTER